jgi:hypothetical protein
MYCHWALHVDLDRPSTTIDFLKRVDHYVKGYFEGKLDREVVRNMLREFSFLTTFKAELRAFFISENLPPDLVDRDDWWSEFVRHYAGVIDEGSVSCDGNAAKGLKHVKQVRFGKGTAVLDPACKRPFNMTWQIALLDGRRMDIDVNEIPPDDRGRTLRYRMHVH